MESPQQNSPVVVHFEKREGNIKYDQGDQYPGSSSRVFYCTLRIFKWLLHESFVYKTFLFRRREMTLTWNEKKEQ